MSQAPKTKQDTGLVKRGNMTQLEIALKIALANTYVMYAKAQSYHWNVEGMFFSMFHDFFGDIYNELHDPIDDLAERIRSLDGYAPISLMDILNAGTVPEDQGRPESVRVMITNLIATNNEVIVSLNKAFEFAELDKNQGVMDILAARLDAHSKHGWMLRASNKENK